MKEKIFGLLLKKEFMTEILKMNEPEEIRNAFAKEGVDLTKEDLSVVIKTLKDMSAGLKNYSSQEVERLSKTVENLDPKVFEAIAAGGDGPNSESHSHATSADVTVAEENTKGKTMDLISTVIQVGGNFVTTAVAEHGANKRAQFNAKSDAEKVYNCNVGGKPPKNPNGAYLAAAAVFGVTLLGIAAMYKKEIQDWLNKKK